ncbi:uncharacterized protein LOC124544426 [Vanessa cardui]|uniref:uncharacterized protein LOC124544426 n=1 Tax=Vanessa cardui TaxID=171605 RepID=UPI001F1308A9|nr:uncharacterized protein LOC124544426 [Vanessa cardui]
MKAQSYLCKSVSVVILYLIHASHGTPGTQFASHVSFNSPARSFAHGVGDPIPVLKRRAHQRHPQNPPIKRLRRPTHAPAGYPRQKPSIPFEAEEVPHQAIGTPWQYDSFMSVPIRVLPPSPYRVDSPDPESLWPLGLFLPPLAARGPAALRRADSGGHADESSGDPYLLQGSEAVAAVARATRHGLLYFHDVPHIESLLANQELRIQNNLKPHRIASIRQSWPYNRP